MRFGVARRALPLLAFLIGVASLPDVARAANNCPWLTEATAAGLIGTESVGSFTEASGTQPAVCTFTAQGSGLARSLTITVEIAKDPRARMAAAAQPCGANAATLNAIGNEAVYCSADGHRGELAERAVGRVRDQIFTIVLSAQAKDKPGVTRDGLKARIYTAAEQVAGNLF